MLNTVYRLVAPRRFEVAFSDIELFKENQVIVRPQFLSICHADQRYYQGLRPADILAKKLNISKHQLSYVTNSSEGEGLIFYGNTIVPFIDQFPKNTKLYCLITTKPEEVKKAGE